MVKPTFSSSCFAKKVAIFLTAKRLGCSKYIFLSAKLGKVNNHKGKQVDLPAPGGADNISVFCSPRAWQNCFLIASMGKEVVTAIDKINL